ncbi:MCE family protein [Nocardia sp. ET3-3]|uniref:MCE family protein n=1 Tax=Nocardia terrae TaxID=2675851 RepID=A0A7K1V2E5_9NOCA|nr:MlaD family protein [Nocardia terrae]MVU80775.1 MCE family protein [Nocardia terrae]
MKLSTRLKTGASAITLCCAVMATTSCSLGPNDLPSVNGGVRGGYDITMRFASALNLPAGADVMLNGLRVGQVGDVAVGGDAVEVTVNVKSDANIPVDVRGVIRQDTLLGDPYIALEEDSTAAPAGYLKPGSTVPVTQTTAPPQLEDTMAVLAYFVNGGSIQKVEDTMSRINKVMPAVPDVRNLASVVSTDLRDLSQHKGEIDRMLNGIGDTAVSVDRRTDALALMFGDDSTHTGTLYWREWSHDFVGYIAVVLPSIGSIFEGGLWMVPMLNSLADAGQTIRSSWDAGAGTTEKLSAFLRNTVLPFIQHPGVNVRSVQAANGDQVIGDVENILRMLGAVK